MKIVAISDTHSLHPLVKVPKCDIVLFAGDCMTCGYREDEVSHFLGWLDSQPADHKVMIAGNHDRYMENRRGLFQDMVKKYPSITYLENSGTEIGGLNIWGTPDCPEFCNWAFNRTEEQMEKSFSNIPDDTDILLSHSPAFGVLDGFDLNGGIVHIGSNSLLRKVNNLPFLRYHVFGHCHSGYGREDLVNYTAINASVVNEQYKISNPPVTFKIYPHG